MTLDDLVLLKKIILPLRNGVQVGLQSYYNRFKLLADPEYRDIHELFNQSLIRHLCQYKVKITDEIFVVLIDIPIVSNFHFEAFKIVSILDMNQGLIIPTPINYVEFITKLYPSFIQK